MTMDMRHLESLPVVAAHDVAELRRKEATYMGSWKRRGGVGAFMMLARKWDRLEQIMQDPVFSYDVFKGIDGEPSGADGTALAEVRDLRRYLMLIEAEMHARGVVRYVDKVPPLPAAGAMTEDQKAAARKFILASPSYRRPDADPDFLLEPSAPVPAEDSNRHGERARPTPAMEEAGLHTEDEREREYRVTPEDTDGRAQPPAGSAAPWSTVVRGDPDDPKSPRWVIVDRRLMPDDSQMEHLVQLRRGLNNTEFKETVPPWFVHMYRWDGSRNEWGLEQRYSRWADTGHR